ncbi:unnamed protein product, partial [Rotaria magnacalcarata]
QNIEEIRQKNLEENQRFLESLRINTVRNDFVKSARSAVGKNETKKHTNIEYKQVERVTRYRLKVESGEIPPYIPEW